MKLTKAIKTEVWAGQYENENLRYIMTIPNTRDSMEVTNAIRKEAENTNKRVFELREIVVFTEEKK